MPLQGTNDHTSTLLISSATSASVLLLLREKSIACIAYKLSGLLSGATRTYLSRTDRTNARQITVGGGGTEAIKTTQARALVTSAPYLHPTAHVKLPNGRAKVLVLCAVLPGLLRGLAVTPSGIDGASVEGLLNMPDDRPQSMSCLQSTSPMPLSLSSYVSTTWLGKSFTKHKQFDRSLAVLNDQA